MAQQPPRRGGWTTAAVLGLLVLLMGRALYVQNDTAQRRDVFMNGDVPRAHKAHQRHDASEHVNFFDQFMRSEAEARSLRETAQRWEAPPPPPPAQQKPLQRPGRGSTPRDECAFMMQKHSVIPGANWGSLGPNGQRRWTKLRCDGLVGGARVRAPPPRSRSRKRRRKTRMIDCVID